MALDPPITGERLKEPAGDPRMPPGFMADIRFVAMFGPSAREFIAEAFLGLPKECQPDPIAADPCAATCAGAPKLRDVSGPALLLRSPKECH